MLIYTSDASSNDLPALITGLLERTGGGGPTGFLFDFLLQGLVFLGTCFFRGDAVFATVLLALPCVRLRADPLLNFSRRLFPGEALFLFPGEALFALRRLVLLEDEADFFRALTGVFRFARFFLGVVECLRDFFGFEAFIFCFRPLTEGADFARFGDSGRGGNGGRPLAFRFLFFLRLVVLDFGFTLLPGSGENMDFKGLVIISTALSKLLEEKRGFRTYFLRRLSTTLCNSGVRDEQSKRPIELPIFLGVFFLVGVFLFFGEGLFLLGDLLEMDFLLLFGTFRFF